jgi:hypothetical protein
MARGELRRLALPLQRTGYDDVTDLLITLCGKGPMVSAEPKLEPVENRRERIYRNPVTDGRSLADFARKNWNMTP